MPSASATPSTAPTPTPTPSATPSSPPAISIADARGRAVGSRVSVRGVVTAQPGRLGTPALLAIDDGTAGIIVRMSDDAPRADEVVIAFAFATRGRLHARLGGISADEVVGEDGLH